MWISTDDIESVINFLAHQVVIVFHFHVKLSRLQKGINGKISNFDGKKIAASLYLHFLRLLQRRGDGVYTCKTMRSRGRYKISEDIQCTQSLSINHHIDFITLNLANFILEKMVCYYHTFYSSAHAVSRASLYRHTTVSVVSAAIKDKCFEISKQVYRLQQQLINLQVFFF